MTEWLLTVADRGRTRGPVPLRDLYLERHDTGEAGARETLLHRCDATAGLAEEVAAWFLSLGVPVEDVSDPLPGRDGQPRTRRLASVTPDLFSGAGG